MSAMQVILSVALLALRAVSALPTNRFSGPKNVIFDTDFLSFPDDAGAFAIANALQRLGKTHILGIASNVNSRFSVPAIDAINTYYGHPDIIFAQNRSVTNETAEPAVDPATNPVFVTTLANASRFPQDVRDGSNKTILRPLEFYRRILSHAEDKSVTILGIGFLNNLDELYRSPGGKQLIEHKVAELIVQGGDFGPNRFDPGPNRAGYNLAINLTAAKVLEVWPSPVTYLGGNIGRSVFTGAALTNTSDSNPVRAAYDIYHNGTGIENGSWDLLATYYGILGISEGSFKYGNANNTGRIEIYENGTAGWNYSAVVPASRRQHFLDFRETNVTIAKKVDKLLALKPTA